MVCSRSPIQVFTIPIWLFTMPIQVFTMVRNAHLSADALIGVAPFVGPLVVAG